MDRTSFLMRRAAARPARYARPARRQRGITLLETLAALLIGAMVIAGIATMINSSLKDSRDQQVAEYQKQLANAVNQAINLNYATVLDNVPAGQITTWSTADMVTQKLIPASYANAQNAFGQSYCLLLQQPVVGQIDALLVSTNGTPIPDADIGYIAANSGVGGGLIKAGNPVTAIGAYGGWSTPVSTWNSQTCAGTPGHLVSQVFTNGPGNSPADDFLYRNAVPNRPDLNAMNVPIGLSMVTAGTGCANFTATSAPFAADTSNHLLTCIGGFWTPTSWREPVANVAALQTLAGQVPAETRVTLDSKLPYTWNGTTWVPVAIDDNGALNFPKVVAAGNQCGLGLDGKAQTDPAALQIGVNSNGEVLSCQSGLWASTATIVLGTMDANCQIIYPASGPPYDYPNCLAPNNANSWDSVSGTMNNYVYRNVSLKRNALITVTSYAHMNYAQCGKSGWLGQLAQYLDIMDSSKTTSYAHTEMQTPNISDASGGVSMSLNQPLPPGNYVISIKTNWGAFTGPGTNGATWFSSYCPAGGGTVINTPLEMGWNVSTVY
ncbi:shufflon system plasmid conjugative transfer pilus tip adhesin PilV [Paraburkholderia flava]|uniref:shufflon system plasmid conjugative transfer pilus tip adhesin PilV n=1 Tax=Paraburkholderia flava TaxID=2547393 RepID=UPI001061F815|nr:shufflon system plasmid conjugative transfer pilus tip adhesin PilV [Paraburkholderia flava]